MALKPNETGRKWRGDRARNLSHEQVLAMESVSSVIDEQLEESDPQLKRYTVDVHHPRLDFPSAAALAKQYVDAGWQVTFDAYTRNDQTWHKFVFDQPRGA